MILSSPNMSMEFSLLLPLLLLLAERKLAGRFERRVAEILSLSLSVLLLPVPVLVLVLVLVVVPVLVLVLVPVPASVPVPAPAPAPAPVVVVVVRSRAGGDFTMEVPPPSLSSRKTAA